MNWATNVLFKSTRLFSVYAIFNSFKDIKHFNPNLLKCVRAASNSGWLLAGCCFSRQSDEQTLLQNTKENYNTASNTEMGNSQIPPLEYDQIASSSSSLKMKMKRSSECIDETFSSHVDIKVEEKADNISLPLSKKTKITNAVEPILGDKNITQTVSEIVNYSPTHVSAEPQKKREDERPKKQRPNYFVAVKISNDQIHHSLKELQNHILMQEDKLKKSMIALETLHITLMVMYIGDLETHARAMKALKNVHLEYDDSMSNNPLELQFKGLSHFQNRVLYAKLVADDGSQHLSSLVESVKKHFAAESIFSTDTREHFTPHLTVAKIDFKDKRQQVKKINSWLYKEFTDQHFGSQKVESIQLLKMTGPKDEDGYYSGDTIYFSAFEPSQCISSLNKLLSTEQQKKDIKKMINKLMKEKL